MKNLFLIDGASGTGKSDLIRYVKDFRDRTDFIIKKTTREKRRYEKENNVELDLEFITEEDFIRNNFDYTYRYSGIMYGFNKSDIKRAFEKNNTLFIIIRDIETMKKVKEDFKHYNVVTLFIYSDRDMIVERLKLDKHSDREIKSRLERLDIAYQSYLENSSFYDEVIINSGSISDYKRICRNIINKYEKRSSVEENQIFVIMSYNPKLNDVFREFKLSAEKVNSNLIVKRLDEQRGDYSITDEILANIRKADLIICDLTEERPNVYYELGYARALGKQIISCAKQGTKLHFDIRNFRTILYASLSQLGEELEKEIRYYYENNRL